MKIPTFKSAFSRRYEQGKIWGDFFKALLAFLAVGSSHFAGFMIHIPPPIFSIAGVSLASSFFETLTFYVGTIVLIVVILKYYLILFFDFVYRIKVAVNFTICVIKLPFRFSWFIARKVLGFLKVKTRNEESISQFFLRALSHNEIGEFPVKIRNFLECVRINVVRYGFALQVILGLVIFTRGYVGYSPNFATLKTDIYSIFTYIILISVFLGMLVNPLFVFSQRDLVAKALYGDDLPIESSTRLRSATLSIIGFILIFSYLTGKERFVTVSSHYPALVQYGRLSGPFNIILRSSDGILVMERLGDDNGRFIFATKEQTIYDISSPLPVLSEFKYFNKDGSNTTFDPEDLSEAYRRSRKKFPFVENRKEKREIEGKWESVLNPRF